MSKGKQKQNTTLQNQDDKKHQKTHKKHIRKCKIRGKKTSRSAKRTLQHQHQSNPKLTKFGSPAE